MADFMGLIQESPAELADRLSQQIAMPACAAVVTEKLWDKPPAAFVNSDQQSTNMCAVNAGTSAMEVVGYQINGKMIQRSRNWLYRESQKRCGIYGDRGVTLGSVIQAGREVGVCREDIYPFRGYFDINAPAGCSEDAATFKITATIDVHSGGYNSVRTVIGQNLGCVLMATYWPIIHANNYLVEQYRPQGNAGHARAYLFLSSKLDSKGRPWVWTANSHADLPWELWSPDAIDQQLEDDPWGTTGITGLSVIEPREVDWAGLDNPFLK
jgi:hypothetical protein